MSNHNNAQTANLLASFFRLLSQPTRIEILLAIGNYEACVCHLEAVIGQRQAYISQQLMTLRDAGVLTTRREGRFIFYRLADDKLLTLIQTSANLLGIAPIEATLINKSLSKTTCGCPHCAPETEVLMNSGI